MLRKKYKARRCTSNNSEVFTSPHVDAILITTRHDSHSELVIQSLKNGKHCFVEKPIASNKKQLKNILNAYKKSQAILMVGFNRRFSPFAQLLKNEIGEGPLVLNYRVNAGFLEKDHWAQNSEIGAGRIVGEMCHFVDLMSFICDAAIISVKAVSIENIDTGSDPDNIQVTLNFSDGSIGSIIYTSVGSPSFSKERFEVFGNGVVGVIDSWRELVIKGGQRNIKKKLLFRSKKGYEEELKAFFNGIKIGTSPINIRSLENTALTTFAIQDSIRTGNTIYL